MSRKLIISHRKWERGFCVLLLLLLLIGLSFESSSGSNGDHEVDEVDYAGDQTETAHGEGGVVIPGIV
jgi:hypothetical protein